MTTFLTIVLGVLDVTFATLVYIQHRIKKQEKQENETLLRKMQETVETGKTDVDVYQKLSQRTNKYEPGFEKRVCCSLGLASEAGEVAGKVDKCIRKNHNTDFTDEQKEAIALELGDVLWYAAGLADELGYQLSDVMKMNIEKLASRDKRNKICGSGDYR